MARRVFMLGRCALAASWLAMVAAAHAQPSAGMSRSGRLLVRPTPPEQLARDLGLALPEAKARHGATLARLAPLTRARLDPLGLLVLEVPASTDEDTLARALLASDDIDLAEPDWVLTPAGESNDPLLASQWQLYKIGAPEAWSLGTGSGVVCAFLDTGVELDHPDLASALLPGYNAVNKLTQAQGGEVSDLNGHGTSVAGAAAAVGNNAVGVSGVGWNFPILPVRVSNSPSGAAFLSDILHGGIWAVDQGAGIVSVSYAGVQSSSVEVFGAWVRSKGSHLVWSADDFGSNYNGFDHASVLIVASTNKYDKIASNSAFGTAIDLVAPGVGVFVPKINKAYGAKTGASYAAPIAAGVLALIRSADPGLTAAEAEKVLLSTCVDLGEPGKDEVYGHGRVDALAALRSIVSFKPTKPHGPFLNPELPDRRAPGLLVHFFALRNPTFLPDLGRLRRAEYSLVTTVDFAPKPGTFAGSSFSSEFGGLFDGYFCAPTTGLYSFTVHSADGSKLWIGDTLVVDHDGLHMFSPASGDVALVEGTHRLTIGYFCADGPPGLVARVAGPGLPDQVIPSSMLFFEPQRADVNRDAKLDVFDFVDFQNLFAQGAREADFDDNGELDIYDVLAFLDAFARAGY